MRPVALLALSLCVLLAGIACRGRASNDVVVGVLAATSGARAPWGTDLVRGVELAVDQVNSRGGILGRRVRLAIADDGSHDDQGGVLVTRLCEREGAVGVLGEISTSANERGAAAAQRLGIPFVQAASTRRDLTNVGDAVFRTVATDAEQAAALARHVRVALARRRAAVLYRRGSMAHLGVADAFAHAFRTLGGDVVVRDTFAGEDAEYVQLAARIRAAGVDVVFVPAQPDDAARVALALRHGRVTALFVGSDDWGAPSVRTLAGDAVLGALVPDAFAPSAPSPSVDRFVQAFRSRNHAQPGSFAALGFDAARWLLAAAARAPGLEPRALRDALTASQLDDAVAGPFTVDARRLLARPVQVMRLEHDGSSFVAAVAP